MKKYIMYTIVFACIACQTYGCGKTDYNEFMNSEADRLIDEAKQNEIVDRLKSECLKRGTLFNYDHKTGNWECNCGGDRCINQTCNEKTGKCGECTDGEERCFGETESKKYQKCEGKKWQDTEKTCKVGDTGDNASCTLIENTCNEEGNLITCIDNQMFIVDCNGNGCKEGSCLTQCTGNDKQCNGDYLEICNEGILERIFCPYGCDKGACLESQSDYCNLDETKCIYNPLGRPVFYKCHENKWEVQDVCDSKTCDIQNKYCGCISKTQKFECRENDSILVNSECKEVVERSGYTQWVEEIENCNYKCNPDRLECNQCEEGEITCDGESLSKCINGHKEIIESCDYGCHESQKKCNHCNLDDAECRGYDLYACDPDTRELTPTLCGTYGCNINTKKCSICKEGDYKCEYDIQSVCKDGDYIKDELCNNFGCNPNTSKCNTCEIGSIKCERDDEYENGHSLRCDNNGLWEQVEICGEFGCNNNGMCNDCEPGTTKCVNDEVWTCRDDGQDYEYTKPCVKGCYNGDCKDCEKKETQCKEQNVQSCNSETYKWSTDLTECAFGCNDGACNKCANASPWCKEPVNKTKIDPIEDNKTPTEVNKAKSVQRKYCENGQWQTETCKSPKSICDNGECKICKENAIQCDWSKSIPSGYICKNDKWTELNNLNICKTEFLTQYISYECSDFCNQVQIPGTSPINQNNDQLFCFYQPAQERVSEQPSYNPQKTYHACVNNGEQHNKILHKCEYGIAVNKSTHTGSCFDCIPGTYKCSDNALYKCSYDSKQSTDTITLFSWNEILKCNDAERKECSADLMGCIQNSSAPQECGQIQCNSDNQLQTCLSSHPILVNDQVKYQQFTVFCPEGCQYSTGEIDAPCDECKDGQQYCNIYGNLDVCINGKWNSGSDGKGYELCNEKKCVQNTDNAYCACDNGQTQCQDNQIEVCIDGQWTKAVNSSNYPVACECKEKQAFCNKSGNIVVCLDKSWNFGQDGKGIQCKPNQTCESDGNTAKCN